MKVSNQEIARRVLASVLERLDGATKDQTAQPDSINQPSVVVVVLGQPGDAAIQSQKYATSATPPASPFHSHPSFARFNIPQPVCSDPAPKKCLMEPDRTCVNSGACEMLGH